MLPRPQAGNPSIRDVLPSLFAAVGVDGMPNALGLPPATSIVVVLIDGLGYGNLFESLGHAPFLRPCAATALEMQTVFPATTATAFGSWATGRVPGEHGMMGYVIRDPESGLLVNQLSGLDDVVDLDSWLATESLAEVAANRGVDSVVVGLPRFVASPFTRVVHRGMRYVGASALGQRVDLVVDEIKAGVPLVILYIPELDQVGHGRGWMSEAWTTKLEEVDGYLRLLTRALPAQTRVYVTADHGMVDVPVTSHVEVGGATLSLDGVASVGGEPRGLQLFLDEPARAAEFCASWQEDLGDRGIAVARQELIDAGWWARGTPDVMGRTGDVVVIAAGSHAFYDSADPQAKARNMRGQHGALTSLELIVPWIQI